MAPSTPPHHALKEALCRADAAMKVNDLDAANAAMTEGAELCLRMQTTGLSFPAEEAASLRQLSEQCGAALAELSNRLNERSLADDKHRRGLLSYQERMRRE